MRFSNFLLASLALVLPVALATPVPATVEEICAPPLRDDKLVKRVNTGICVDQRCVVDVDTGKTCITAYCTLAGKEGLQCHCIPLTD
ncbi:hypothetical protein CLAIMM_14636 [Cladophialophora immunda]|nr:hypothetical protein CLAIMM_14636 [Cladophialophora immunda]